MDGTDIIFKSEAGEFLVTFWTNGHWQLRVLATGRWGPPIEGEVQL